MSLDEAGIARVANGMLACTLPKAEWTHEAHFATRIVAAAPPPRSAPARSDAGADPRVQPLRRRHQRCHAGYHETITQASLRAAHARLVAGGDAPLAAILAALMASPLGHPDWLFAYWTRETLMAPPARLGWVAPISSRSPGRRSADGRRGGRLFPRCARPLPAIVRSVGHRHCRARGGADVEPFGCSIALRKASKATPKPSRNSVSHRRPFASVRVSLPVLRMVCLSSLLRAGI